MVYDSIRPLTKSAGNISDPVAPVIVAIACALIQNDDLNRIL